MLNRINYTLILLCTAFVWFVACRSMSSKENIAITKTVQLFGGGYLSVQKLPYSYQQMVDSTAIYDFFRIIIIDSTDHKNEDWSYIDYGFQDDIKIFVDGDTLCPALFHRVANGKKYAYEFIVAFSKLNQNRKYNVFINDKALGAGRQEIEFP